VTMADDHQARADRQDIGELLVRYATGIDRRDFELFRACFTEDCHCDYGDISVWDGVDAITDYMARSHAGLGHTLHRISNQAVQIDGDEATARSYVDAVLLAEDGRSGFHAVGFYDDELVRTSDGWRIHRRTYTMARFVVLGPSAALS
jgi:3-phenylpropionate/cinnamic acid dioxygenase small subunit